MRIISRKRLKEFWSVRTQRDSKNALLEWLDDARWAMWETPADVKQTFGKRVDFVQTRRTVTTLAVFDIAGNKYRMVAAIHFLKRHPDKGRIYILKVMTHVEYDQNKWKDEF
jgi:mRNA interferase HigB